MEGLIHVDQLSFKYDYNIVLEELQFAIPNGSFVSILGPNGSGKTTLLKNICNLLRPSKGSVLIDDKDVKAIDSRELAKNMAVVHQGNEASYDLTVFDVVLMGRYPYLKRFQSEGPRDIEVAEKSMVDTGVWHLREKNIREISGGERQRVAIARALTQEPRVLLLDEPISHLDIKHQINILELCRKLNQSRNITTVAILHDINMASRYSDYILLLSQGRVKSMDTPDKVLTKENIESVYDVKVEIINGPIKERPYIIPVGF